MKLIVAITYATHPVPTHRVTRTSSLFSSFLQLFYSAKPYNMPPFHTYYTCAFTLDWVFHHGPPYKPPQSAPLVWECVVGILATLWVVSPQHGAARATVTPDAHHAAFAFKKVTFAAGEQGRDGQGTSEVGRRRGGGCQGKVLDRLIFNDSRVRQWECQGETAWQLFVLPHESERNQLKPHSQSPAWLAWPLSHARPPAAQRF